MKILVVLVLSLNVFASPNIIIGEDEIEHLVSINPSEKIYEKSMATARLVTPGLFKDYCTGFMISDSYFMTSNGCINKERRVLKGWAEFDYVDESKAGEMFYVESIVYRNTMAGVAVLRLKGMPGKKYGHYKVANDYAPGDKLNLFQHYAGKTKALSRKNCSFYGMYDGMLLHTCDTGMGSSGSAILNDRFEVVGVHQGGITSDQESLNYGYDVSLFWEDLLIVIGKLD